MRSPSSGEEMPARWSDGLVDRVLGLGPGVFGSIPNSGKDFVFPNTLVTQDNQANKFVGVITTWVHCS